MRVELWLEQSGPLCQEAMVVKACAEDSKNFESIAKTLVDHYSMAHDYLYVVAARATAPTASLCHL